MSEFITSTSIPEKLLGKTRQNTDSGDRWEEAYGTSNSDSLAPFPDTG